MLLRLQPTAVTRLHRAVAVRYVEDARAALAELDELETALGNYPLFHAIRGELLRADGRTAEALQADRRAAELTSNPAQLDLLHSRIGT
jgi:RNA polymerase sigma-70 factor (ECF subfamily)